VIVGFGSIIYTSNLLLFCFCSYIPSKYLQLEDFCCFRRSYERWWRNVRDTPSNSLFWHTPIKICHITHSFYFINQLPVLQVATLKKKHYFLLPPYPLFFASAVYTTLKTHVSGERCCNYRKTKHLFFRLEKSHHSQFNTHEPWLQLPYLLPPSSPDSAPPIFLSWNWEEGWLLEIEIENESEL